MLLRREEDKGRLEAFRSSRSLLVLGPLGGASGSRSQLVLIHCRFQNKGRRVHVRCCQKRVKDESECEERTVEDIAIPVTEKGSGWESTGVGKAKRDKKKAALRPLQRLLST